jgi:drug/metabolite transporter (DMT)-like permease
MLFCVLGARIWSGTVAAVLLAVVSASSWALFAVLTKAIVDVFDGGVWVLLRTPELYVWALVAVLGTVFQQSSFRASSLTASLPTMTVAEPLVASLLGVTVLGETLDADGLELLALVIAVAVVVVATTALARGEAATMAGGAAELEASVRLPVDTIGGESSGPIGLTSQAYARHSFYIGS